jgi:hypothetical protein
MQIIHILLSFPVLSVGINIPKFARCNLKLMHSYYVATFMHTELFHTKCRISQHNIPHSWLHVFVSCGLKVRVKLRITIKKYAFFVCYTVLRNVHFRHVMLLRKELKTAVLLCSLNEHHINLGCGLLCYNIMQFISFYLKKGGSVFSETLTSIYRLRNGITQNSIR